MKKIALILLSIAIIGCTNNQNKNATSPTPPQLLTSVDSISGNEYTLVEDDNSFAISNPITIKFENDKISGSAGINKFFGGYEMDEEGNITTKPFISTRMAGSPELMARENEFLSEISKIKNISTKDNTLVLTLDDSKKLIFTKK